MSDYDRQLEGSSQVNVSSIEGRDTQVHEGKKDTPLVGQRPAVSDAPVGRSAVADAAGLGEALDIGASIRALLARPRDEVVNECKRYVVGQDQVLSEVVGLTYSCLQRMERRLSGVDDLDLPRACAFMLAGSTASGKSFIMKVVCRVLGLTLVSVDCSGITGAGWVGDSVSTELRRVVEAQRRNPGRPVVAFWDEADKLVRQTKEGSRSFDSQGNFLKLLDGDPLELEPERQGQTPVRLDAGRVLNVFAGAFMGIESIVRKRLLSGGIAMAQGGSAGLMGPEELRSHMTLQDLVSWGFMPEFVGRFGAVVSVPALSRESLLQIVKGSSRSLERRVTNLLGPGRAFRITDAAAQRIASDAVASGLGARRIDQLANHFEAEATVRLGCDRDVNVAVLDVGEDGRLCLGFLREEVPDEAERSTQSGSVSVEVPAARPSQQMPQSRFEPDLQLVSRVDAVVGTSLWQDCTSTTAGIELVAKKLAGHRGWKCSDSRVREAAELLLRAVTGYLPFDPEARQTLGYVMAYLKFMDVGLKDGWTYLDTFFFGTVEVCGLRGLEERAMTDPSVATPASVTALACYRRFLRYPERVRREAGQLARERTMAATTSEHEAAWLVEDIRDVATSVGMGAMGGMSGADGFIHML